MWMHMSPLGVHKYFFQYQDTNRPFSYPELLNYALQLAQALCYMHDDAVPGKSLVMMIFTYLYIFYSIGWH